VRTKEDDEGRRRRRKKKEERRKKKEARKRLMHISDDELVAHYYGELTEADEARTAAHLDECEACRSNHARLKRVMAAVDMATMPEPPADFEATVWQRLQPSIAADVVRNGKDAWSPGSIWKLGGWGTMAAGLLLAAFLAGRMWPGESADQSANGARGANGASSASANGAAGGASAGAGSETGADPFRERVLLVDLGDHFDRTEQALVEFVSRTDATRDAEVRGRTEDLVVANRLYRGTAEVTGDQAVTDVLDDLERTLIEIAGVPANAPASELEAIRRRIDARDLLFKLRVMRMELEQRANDPRPAKRQGPRT
jgi:hypothetical protein